MTRALCLSLMFLASGLLSAPNKADLLKNLVSHHTAVFGVDDLFKSPLGQKEVSNWNSIIDAGKKFVEQNSVGLLNAKDDDLIKPLRAVEKANIDLMNAIKAARATLGSKTDLTAQIKIFSTIADNMVTVQKNLERASFSINKENKEQARELLKNMALFIETTALKAKRDASKRL